MTKEETIKIMAMLNAFYAGGKNDPKTQAHAWHLVLGKYDFRLAEMAVLHFAENDNRDYATFPTVGKIVTEINAMQMQLERPINEIIRSISYGKDYEQLPTNAKNLISEDVYNDWLEIDAEEFANRTSEFTDILKGKRDRLLEHKHGQDQ